MKKIINEAWSLEELDSVRLAKYMRCLFQIALSDDIEAAEQLLNQIQDLTEQAAEVRIRAHCCLCFASLTKPQTETPYPLEELEWIITTAFNQGIDLYCNGNDIESRNWAHRAINLAHLYPDGGVMLKLLQDKLLGLKFDS